MTTVTDASLTPMMQQYTSIRKDLPKNTLLLFRLGDFYELFSDDAELASSLLGLTLTRRNGTPMAGIPHHAADSYINKLLRAGKKIAICDQMEPPTPGKLVKRQLTRILTPGTAIEDTQLEANENHYLLAIQLKNDTLNAAWLDLTTGDFTIASDANSQNLLSTLHAICPKELIVPENDSKLWQNNPYWNAIKFLTTNKPVTEVPDFFFDTSTNFRNLTEALNVLTLEGFGIEQDHPAISTACALITYATDTLCNKPRNITRIKKLEPTQCLIIDPATLKNLEIFESIHNTPSRTLIATLNNTVTAAGARLLEKYLITPLLDVPEIHRRQNSVAAFIEQPSPLNALRHALKHTRDLTRILCRLQNGLRNPRELAAIRETLLQLPHIKTTLVNFEHSLITELNQKINTFDELKLLLAEALNDELPSKSNEGSIIRQGFDAELDRLRSLTSNNQSWIANLERSEQDTTTIKTLKIKYTDIFGYFIEITKSNLHLVPSHYIRKQTLSNVERFYTPELKIKEQEILQAHQKAMAREEELFLNLIQNILSHSSSLYSTAEALAQIDLFSAWAHLALERNYCQPSIDTSDIIEIEQGRHPVIEQVLQEEATTSFVPNDTWLKSDNDQIILITGPNMAGKSTYIRQVALITLMAQIGCWVPAKRCHIGIVDRIFSRIGANDELSRGFSTFMVEMKETANILHNATSKSLIILDEIGRGTSTYDGLSIAWSTIEYLHGNLPSGPKTLFATHYHELIQLENTLPRLRNYSVAVKEWNDQIIFVRQVIPGAADKSYGIQVARLAGLPPAVISRAKEVLHQLENNGPSPNISLPSPKHKKASTSTNSQLSFF